MVSPLIRLILWTTEKMYDVLMKPFPKGAKECSFCVYWAEDELLRIFRQADLTSYRIANILAASYLHAPLCPLPAELPYLVPVLTWDCLEMVYRQVRYMAIEKHHIGKMCSRIPRVPPPQLGPDERRENEIMEMAEFFFRNL